MLHQMWYEYMGVLLLNVARQQGRVWMQRPRSKRGREFGRASP